MSQAGATRRGAGSFYPRDLPQRLELQYASHTFPTLEINGSFYSLQRPEYYRQWHNETPDGFVFAVKGSRYITHMKKLRDIEAPLANYFASGLFNMRAKLGPIPWQFPPNFRYERERMARFFDLLPHDTDAALRLARKRDSRMKGARAWRSTSGVRCGTQWKSATRASSMLRSSICFASTTSRSWSRKPPSAGPWSTTSPPFHLHAPAR